MAAANRTAQLLEFLTCYSKFIAYLVASQNRNNSFQHVLMRKSTLPQNTTTVTHHQIGQGFFSLPDSDYEKSSCWTATEHTSGLEVPYLQSHEGKQQQIPDATPGDEMGPCSLRPSQLALQYLPPGAPTSPVPPTAKNLHPHNAQSSCAAAHTIISVWESHGTH